MKKAGALTNGYIQFVILGSRESKGGLMAATQDENTVMFAKKEQKMADEINLASKHQPTILSETKTNTAKKFVSLKHY